jgi:RHS repeat-associated protein
VDNPNPVNGNLYLNIPLVSFPQRGHQLKLNFRIFYNDKKWFVYNQCSPTTENPCHYPSNIWTWSQTPYESGPWPNIMGVFVTDDQHLDFGIDDAQSGFGGNNEGGPPGSGNGYQQYSIGAQLYSYFVAGPDAAKHYIGDSASYTCSGTCPTIPTYPSESYPASDASGFTGNQSAVTGADGVLYSGARITDTAGNFISFGSNGWTDTIGRQIPGSFIGVGTSSTVQSSGSITNGSPIPGIQMSSVPTACPSSTEQARQWDVPAVSGTTATYYICYKTFSYNTDFSSLNSQANFAGAQDASGTTVLLSAIVLPNGQMYVFDYDNDLSLTSLTLPTGGNITYTWQNLPFGLASNTPISRVLKTRIITPGNGQPQRIWQYGWYPNYQPNPEWPGQYSFSLIYGVVTDPAGNDTERIIGGSDLAGNATDGQEATQISVYAGCSPHHQGCGGVGTLVESEAYAFRSGGGPLTRGPSSSFPGFLTPSTTVKTIQTSLGPLVSKKVLVYAPSYGTCQLVQYPVAGNFTSNGTAYSVNSSSVSPCTDPNKVIEEDDYDWGAGTPGPLLKKTLTQYEWQNDTGTSSSVCRNFGQNGYLAANLLALPQCVITQAGAEDGVSAGTPLAETDYAYDESPSPSGTLGNETSLTHWLSGATSSPRTRTVYNTQAMPIAQYDARGFETQITYDSTGEFPQTVTLPSTTAGTSGPSISHIEEYQFDSNTGHTLSHADQNNQQTRYSYSDPISGIADPLGRLKQITYPTTFDGTSGASAQGTKSYSYNDTVGSLSVTETDIQNTVGGAVQSETEFDGLGEVIHQYQKSDPQNQVIIDTNYDSMGRVALKSNPYRSLSDPTYGTTATTYDALGRQATVTHNPDNSFQQWCYAGLSLAGQTNCATNAAATNGTDPWIDITDEAMLHWQRVSDAGGRLRAVMEPGASGSPSLETDYSYDALGNLLGVKQNGHTGETARLRSFSYDSLSRLVCASNAENSSSPCPVTASSTYIPGTTGYSYDMNSNITLKTNPRGISSTFSYDSLNRLLSKTYSDGTTPTSVFGYDGGDNNGNPLAQPSLNSVGRPSFSSNGGNPASIYSYDAMGRISSQYECLLSDCSYGISVTAQYDLAGELVTLTYPDGRRVQQTYDSAGRFATSSLAAVDGSPVSQTFVQYVSYFADGSPNVMVLGNGVQQTFGRNTRLQTQSSQVMTSQGPLPSGQLLLSRSYCYAKCSPVAGGTVGTVGTADDGDVWQITDGLNGVRTQDFTYDSLNRIHSFALGGTVLEQYQIDSFGNMAQTLGGRFIPTYTSSSGLPATNQITNLPCAPFTNSTTGYDGSGNQLCTTDQDGGISKYSYDGESRLAKINTLNSSTPFVSYVYGAEGERTGKYNADGTFTEYVYFGGQVIAERDDSYQWTDYVFAGDRRIARLRAEDQWLFVTGSEPSTPTNVAWTMPVPRNGSGGNYVVKAGDQLCVRQLNTNAAVGGPVVSLTNGTIDTTSDDTWTASDNLAIGALAGTYPSVWVNRCVDLSRGGAASGYSITGLGVQSTSATAANLQGWYMLFADMAIVSTDGTVTQITLSATGGPQSGGFGAATAYPYMDDSPAFSVDSTHYFMSDHLGSSQMEIADGGWPIYSGQFAPYGQEMQNAQYIPPTQSDGSTSNYKFTGKERDQESGNDYFGARYYGSTMGRFMSADWSAKAEPVPYAKLENPQSLNLYGYVGNNPLARVDMDGHSWLQRYLEQNSASFELDAFVQNQQDQQAQKQAQAQQKSQTQPANANMNVVLSAGFPPKANHTENNGAFFVVQWEALKLDKNGAVIPHSDPNTGLYNSRPPGAITLQENQGAGFTGKYSGHDVGVTSDNIIAGHPPFLQQWSVGGQPVRVVIGGTASHPVTAWTVKVTVTPNGPIYSAAP